MKKAFDMSDLGLLYFYLSIKVRKDVSGIVLRQTHYVKHIHELGGMIGCNPAYTPIEEKLKLSQESTVEEVDPTHYWWLIRSLHYLVHTRSDIAFAVGYMSRFMARWMMEHLKAVKRILRCVVGTLNYGLHYGRALDTARFVSYYDSDLVGDVDTSSAQLGQCFSSVIAWDCLEDGSIKDSYIATTDQLADILTKSLGKSKFQDMRERIGLQQITSGAQHKA
ncbi:uncharacterized mitochondrial protein AtMg00810-like [Miscanthus floridulus]|uniref:uncharacterized mitochondrial protein AtMg00810-like n=1 Tax=Miscanthus floridulus TaxID=154761 RepID=UPI00345A9CE7